MTTDPRPNTRTCESRQGALSCHAPASTPIVTFSFKAAQVIDPWLSAHLEARRAFDALVAGSEADGEQIGSRVELTERKGQLDRSR